MVHAKMVSVLSKFKLVYSRKVNVLMFINNPKNSRLLPSELQHRHIAAVQHKMVHCSETDFVLPGTCRMSARFWPIYKACFLILVLLY
jgi:hypothetical protein